MKREKYSSGSIWERKMGYSRAVKFGNMIFVSGTTSVDTEGKIYGKGDPYQQSKFIYEKIIRGLAELGATVDDIARVVIYTTNIHHWELIGNAHKEFLKQNCPATTIVEVSNLVHHEMLVEIEVTAIVN